MRRTPMDEEELVKKWLADALTEAEWEAFRKLDDYALNISIIEQLQDFKASHFSVVDDFETFNARVASNKKTMRRIPWIKPLLRIAGILVIGLGIYFMFFFNALEKVQTSAGEKNIFKLPDASEVTLNELSEIHYSEKDWNKNREVTLEGEALFDVTTGAKFDVITSAGTVSVLGTKFNVKQREHYFEVVCYEGKVSVSSEYDPIELNAGNRYRISNGKPAKDKTPFSEPQWTENKSSFDDKPLHVVIAELEKQYNIKVISHHVDTDDLFSGGFIHDDLEEALKAITEPMGLEYEKETSDRVRLYDSEQ